MNWAQEVMEQFRSKHTIFPVKDWDDDLHGYTMRCKLDGIRVHPSKGGSYRHDMAEVRRTSLIAGGVLPKIDWTIAPRVIAEPTPEQRAHAEVLREASDLLKQNEEHLRLIQADVDEANRWTTEELVTIAAQSGMDVTRA